MDGELGRNTLANWIIRNLMWFRFFVKDTAILRLFMLMSANVPIELFQSIISNQVYYQTVYTDSFRTLVLKLI